MFHCHILEHEDRGMMGQFVVVEPGEAAAPHAATATRHPLRQRRSRQRSTA
jgi:hypothetical protein